MKDSLAKHRAIFHHFRHSSQASFVNSPSIVVGVEEEEKSVGEIGIEGIRLCPINGPLVSKGRRRSSKRKTTRRGTYITFSGRTAYPYKVCYCFVILSSFL